VRISNRELVLLIHEFLTILVRLYGPMFEKLNAKILEIEDTLIEIIEDYTFYGVNKTLEKLVMKNTKLMKITPLSFGVRK